MPLPDKVVDSRRSVLPVPRQARFARTVESVRRDLPPHLLVTVARIAAGLWEATAATGRAPAAAPGIATHR